MALRSRRAAAADDIDGIETLATPFRNQGCGVRASAEGGEANRAVAGTDGKKRSRAQGTRKNPVGVTSAPQAGRIDGDPNRSATACASSPPAKPETKD